MIRSIVKFCIEERLIVILVALLHLYFLVLEMFLWEKPLGLKAFRLSAEQAAATRVLAANMGLYNGFLAAGLIWGVTREDSAIQVFFLACVVIAGIYGAATVSRKILCVQAAPAAVGLGLILL